MEFFEKQKKKWKEYNLPENRYERTKATAANQKARNEFKKLLEKQENIAEITEEQEAILFSQAYELLLLKNPAAAKYPEFAEYNVEKNESVYKVTGYVDCTNSYGAQVRTQYIFELMKVDGEWTCLHGGLGSILVYILVIGLLISGPSIFACCSLMN